MKCLRRYIHQPAIFISVGVLLVACGEDPAPATPHDVLLHVCKYGEKVSFGAGGDSHRFRGPGWSHTERSFTSTNGPEATLLVRIPPSKGRVELQMSLSAQTNPPELLSQPVEVSVNEISVARWDVGPDAASYRAIIPTKLVARGDLLTIKLQIPPAVSPAAPGGLPDQRPLGLKCFEMRISKYRKPSPGRSMTQPTTSLTASLTRNSSRHGF